MSTGDGGISFAFFRVGFADELSRVDERGSVEEEVVQSSRSLFAWSVALTVG